MRNSTMLYECVCCTCTHAQYMYSTCHCVILEIVFVPVKLFFGFRLAVGDIIIMSSSILSH